MSRPGTYELTHPESLSEHQLREILKNSCIEILKFEKLCRSELLEIYKRVAMPLPQRQRRNIKSLSTEDTTLEKSDETTSDDKPSLTIDRGNKRESPTSETDKSKPINEQKPMNKKIRLCSTPKVEIECNGIYKRNCEEQNEELLTRKRQKITWP